jgi:hypothetical protein
MNTPVIAGRAFGARDTVGSPLVAVINETFAKRYFPAGAWAREAAAAQR